MLKTRYCALCGNHCTDRICDHCKSVGYWVDDQGKLHHGCAEIIVNTLTAALMCR
jgi:hypothetical protein